MTNPPAILLSSLFTSSLIVQSLADVRYVRKPPFACHNCPTPSPKALEFHPEEHIGILITLAVIIVLYLAIIFCTCYPMIKNICSNKSRNQPTSASANTRSSRGSIATTATVVDAESA